MKNLLRAKIILLAGLAVLGIQGCASIGGNGENSLTNTYWKLLVLDGKPITPEQGQREAHLVLQEDDHRIAGSGGCNRIMGSYRLDGSSLSFGKLASTMMACPNMHDEQAFLAALEKIKRWRIEDARLVLLDETDQPLASFAAVALK